MKQLKKHLQSVTKGLKSLSVKTEKIIKQLDKLEKTQAVSKKRKKSSVKTDYQSIPIRIYTKSPATTKDVYSGVKDFAHVHGIDVVDKKRTNIDTVLSVIKRSKKGVDTATLMKKTGFKDGNIRNTVYRLRKSGKIKSAARGKYSVAKG